jgi:hypothetical protein
VRRQRNFVGPAAMGGMVGLWGASSLIKSIQRGTVAVTNSGLPSATTTISAVDMPNARLRLLGYGVSGGSANTRMTLRMSFTNATTITVQVHTATDLAAITASYEVIEYMPGVVRSIQRGTMLGNNGVATITAVDMAKTQVDWLGSTGADANTNITSIARVQLTSTTGVTGTSVGTTQDTIGFQAVEFY